MSEAKWVSVYGCDAYRISDSGQIQRVSPQRGAKVGRVLVPRKGANGYLYVNIGGRSQMVHRLVLESFAGPDRSLECCHVNGQKTDNRLENLRWGSKAQNYADRVRHGGGNHGEKHGLAQLTEPVAIRILESALPAAKEAKLHGVSRSCVQMIRKGKRWNYLQKTIRGASARA